MVQLERVEAAWAGCCSMQLKQFQLKQLKQILLLYILGRIDQATSAAEAHKADVQALRLRGLAQLAQHFLVLAQHFVVAEQA